MIRTMVLARWLLAGWLLAGWTGAGLAQQEQAVLLQMSEPTFSRPHDLTLSSDGALLYVADVGNDVVRVLDPATLRDKGAIGAGELESPHDVFFDSQGRLLVADTGNDRVAIYEVQGPQGRLVGELKGELDSPEGVTETPDGRIVVTNAGAHNFVVFVKGRRQRTVGSGGRGQDNYVRPHDVISDDEGRLYVTDPGNNRIHILNPREKLIRLLGAPAHAFNEPKYLALDGPGWLYVADEYNNRIVVLDTDFRQRATIPRARGGRAHRLNQPEGVTVRGKRVWVSDTYNNMIVLYEMRAMR